MRLDEKLIHLRREKGLTQLELAEAVKVSRQAVSKWESGGGIPSTENLRSLSELYGVSVDYLLDENKDDPPAIVHEESSVVYGPDYKPQGKRKLWIMWRVIGVAVLVLLVCCLFGYKSSQEKNDLDLHAIQGEDGVLPEGTDFNLDWE